MADTRCYLSNNLFNEDAVEKEILRFKIKPKMGILFISGTNFITSIKSIKICGPHLNTYCTIGINPNHLGELTNKCHDDLFHILSSYLIFYGQKIIAISECGLDFIKMNFDRNFQIEMFKKQVELAIEFRKPLCICENGAFDTMTQIYEEYDVKGLWKIEKVINSFNRSEEEVLWYLNKGFYFSISGNICNDSCNSDLLKIISIKKIIIGSCSPFYSPNIHQRKINVPANISYIIVKLAQIYDMSYDDVLTNTYENTKKIFGIQYIEEDFDKNKSLFDMCPAKIKNNKNEHIKQYIDSQNTLGKYIENSKLNNKNACATTTSDSNNLPKKNDINNHSPKKFKNNQIKYKK